MLEVRYNPFLDDVLRRHLLAAAERLQIGTDDLEEILEDEADALDFLRECGPTTWHAYVEDASRRVDYVGWVVVPRTGDGGARSVGGPVP